MEEEELEMTKDDFQKWIQGQVNKNKLISDMVEKCHLLQSLLERRQNQAAQLKKLYRSVAECEEIVKKQYSLLGWEYEDTHFDDDNEEETGGTAPPSSPQFVHADSRVSSSPTTNDPTPLLTYPPLINLKRQPVVVLRRLSPHTIASLRSPTSDISEDELLDDSVSDTHSDAQWEPGLDECSNGSDFSISSFNSGSRKRRRIEDTNKRLTCSSVTTEANADSSAQSIPAKRSDPKNNSSNSTAAKRKTAVKSNAAKSSDAQAKSTVAKSHSAEKDGGKFFAVKSTITRYFAVKSTGARSLVVKGTGTKNNAAKGTASKSNAEEKTTSKSNAEEKTASKSNAEEKTASKSNAEGKTASKSNAEGKTASKSNAEGKTASKSNAEGKTASKSNAANTSTSQAKTSPKSQNNTTKTSTAPGNTNGVTPVGKIVNVCQSSKEATKTKNLPSLPEIKVNMNVLARRRSKGWQQGKILEIVKKEDGRLKYKINFDNQGRSLVSGHHIAFDCMAKVDHLDVGGRVVVTCRGDKPQYLPGVVAELPTRKNRMRFLVLLDDHTPVYVGLPLIHLVCKPLPDPLDDIQHENHREFMRKYLEDWPHPPQTRYTVGQIINAEHEGVQQKCEVRVVDSSLIQVVFQKDKHEEWIYRGSLRLEHMINMMEHLEAKKENGQKNKSTAVKSEASKSAH